MDVKVSLSRLAISIKSWVSFLGDIDVAQLFAVIAQPFLDFQEISGNALESLLLQIAHLKDLAFVGFPQLASPGDPNSVTLLQDQP